VCGSGAGAMAQRRAPAFFFSAAVCVAVKSEKRAFMREAGELYMRRPDEALLQR